MTDLAEQMERMGKELLALAAEVNANALTGADDPPKANLKQTQLKQGERTQGLSERPMSPLPKEEPRDDDADCEAAIALIRKTRQASISHFQRSLNWGYNRASRVLGLLQSRGIVSEKTGEMSYEILALPMPAAKKRSGVVRKTESKKVKSVNRGMV